MNEEKEHLEDSNSSEKEEQRLFTQDEVNRIVKKRVERQTAQYNKKIEDLELKLSGLDELQKKAEDFDDLKKENSTLQSRMKHLNNEKKLATAQNLVADQTGLPLKLVKNLAGKNFNELMESAKPFTNYSFDNSKYPRIKNSSTTHSLPVSKQELFGEWLNNNF